MTAVRIMPWREWSCGECIKKGKQAERGCEQDTPLPMFWWSDQDGVERKRCPRRPIYEDVNWFNGLISTYNHYKNGILPHDGGWVNQTALFGDTMLLIQSINSTCDEIEAQRNREGQSNQGEWQSVLKKRR